MLFTITSDTISSIFAVLFVLLTTTSAICCFSAGISSNIRCLETEKNALLQFKQGLVDNSNVLGSWESKKDCCQWRGITCSNQTGHVTMLDLYYNSSDIYNLETPLSGVIAPLLELRYLNYLDLSFNNFEGKIPDFIGSLNQLKQLKLAGASLTDLYLNMSSLNFSKVVNWPHSISKLPSLVELQLSSCSLPNVNLRSLSFVNSSTSLEVLELSDNFLNSSIFYWMANISTSLVHIGLLQGLIPDVFSNMVSLTSLDLSYNQLEGGIPKSFRNLCRLESLNLWENKLSDKLQDFIENLSCAQDTLESLQLSGNPFWGPFPDNLTRFSSLKELYIDGTNMSGPLPKSFQQLYQLRSLSLVSNQFSGPLPDFTEVHFLNLSRLQFLDVSYNPLSFNLSPYWNPPFQLNSLDMSSSNVGPEFPKWIQTQRKLTALGMSNAGISGELPDCWMQYQALHSLNLAKNNFSGKVPSSLGQLTYVVLLRLHDNNLSGELPPSLKNCTELRVVDLGANKLSGNIPAWIGPSLTNLLVLRLRSNEFYGSIPLSLCSLPALHVLDLSQNNISGALPHCLPNITALSSVSTKVEDNWILGFVQLVWKGIEIEFGENLKHLRSIDISNNNLNGDIPQSITSLLKLISLNLSRNGFTGVLPSNFGQLEMLESLDLSRNQISERIPLSTQLQTFNASAFMGNLGLCGPPLTQECPGDGATQDPAVPNGDGGDQTKQEDDGLISFGFYVSMVLGLIIGFWGACGTLLLKSSWRYAYFRYPDNIKDRIM
ncbi:unnamed protein product [Prunus armeniaca]